MTVFLPGMRLTADRLNDYTLDAQISSGLVAATDFAVNNFWANRQGAAVELNMYLNYTGAGITATTGNITDTACCTVPVGWRPNSASTINGHWESTTESGGFYLATDGLCTLRTATDNINTGANLRLHIVFNMTP